MNLFLNKKHRSQLMKFMSIMKLMSRIICILLTVSIFIGLVGACADNEITVKRSDEELFDILMDEYFEEWITRDTLSMNYFLADPEKMGIERPETTYGKVVSSETIEESKENTALWVERLESFEYENLRYDQKVVYDILVRNAELYNILERDESYSYYTGYIRPYIGFQVQLPVLLAEYNFFTADDIERYLELLADTQRYFNDIIEFERERSRRGLFLSEANVDKVIEQIESFLENRDDNLLITVFDYRIDNYPGLDAGQRDTFKQKNKELVLNNVLAAYDTLLAAMHDLRGVGENTGGLAGLPGGPEFAHAFLRLRIGTDRTVNDLRNILDDWLSSLWISILTTIHGDPNMMDGLVNETLGQIPHGTPEEYIDRLKRYIADEFPLLAPTNLDIIEVHESLQEHMSPAFYLAPAVDRFNDNVVYINPSSINDDLFLFTVLAHESYPGHMYQTVYFLQQSPHPIRTSLSNTGYSEGWATYSEMKSYFFPDLAIVEATLMWNFRFYDMLLVAYIDLCVNLLNWDIGQVRTALADYNIFDNEMIENIYNRVIGIPLNSLLYALGYLELTALIQDSERILGNHFDLADFHRYFLEFGPAPFPVIRKHLNDRITEDPATALK